MRFVKVTLIICCFVLACYNQRSYGANTTAKATVVVVDENGTSIEGAKAGFAFEKNKTVGVGVNVELVEGFTDGNGRYSATNGNDNNLLTYGVEKEGYYYTTGKIIFTNISLQGWEPWNPELNVVLRKIENPVPMYAKNIGQFNKLEIPELDKEVGFDLISSDWVAPYGTGKYSDFIFIFTTVRLIAE